MSSKQQQEDRINADLSKRLQEKLASVKMIEGRMLTNDKTPESKEKDC